MNLFWKRVHVGLNEDVWSRGPYSIKPVGSTASAKNNCWGLYKDDTPFKETSRLRGRDIHLCFDSLKSAKKKVERLLVADGLLSADDLPPEPKRITAQDRLAEVEAARDEFLSASKKLSEVLTRPDSHFMSDYERTVLRYLLEQVGACIKQSHSMAETAASPL